MGTWVGVYTKASSLNLVAASEERRVLGLPPLLPPLLAQRVMQAQRALFWRQLEDLLERRVHEDPLGEHGAARILHAGQPLLHLEGQSLCYTQVSLCHTRETVAVLHTSQPLLHLGRDRCCVTGRSPVVTRGEGQVHDDHLGNRGRQ